MSRTAAKHYVATYADGAVLIARNDRFWLGNCGCRERNPAGCKRSRTDLCLSFSADAPTSGSGRHEIARNEADAVLRYARAQRLVVRPFRDASRRMTIGICFCCDDCCEYFADRGEPGSLKHDCETGRLIESTRIEDCSHCGACVPVCYFGARKLKGGDLMIDRSRCYGCGLCVDVCPAECIRLESRT